MDMLSLIRQPVEAELELYRKLFDATFAHADDFLGAALQYVRGRQGKMMRPLLVLLMAREFGPVGEASLRAAVTLELLHTASLIHDDVVDESAERRGRASANAQYGNKVAVLLGDYMLSMALQQSALTGDPRVVSIVARLGGTLSEGEVRQLGAIRSAEVSEANYFSIIGSKTAALFAACARLGALTAGASQEAADAAARFAEIVGLCFQIRDDIFDYFDDTRIGKPTGNDMAEGKLTLPAIYAVNRSPRPEVREWVAKIKAGTASRSDILALVAFTKAEGGIDYARRRMEQLRSEALQLLGGFSNADVRLALERYLDFTIGRNT